MNTDFFERIAEPNHPALSELSKQARSGVEDILNDWDITDVEKDVIRNLSFTYYHDWENDDPDCIFLIQDPGPLYDRHRGEVETFRELGPNPDPLDLVSLHRKFAISWLLQRNPDFAENFVKICDDHNIANPKGDWGTYIEEHGFFDDFYLTDVVKFRTDSHTHRQRLASYQEYLREELQYINPDLIFVFGSDAWSIMRKQMELNPVDSPKADTSKVTEAHGYPFRASEPIETIVIPLVHFSGRIYHTLLRNSYFDYLNQGLNII